MHLLIKGVKITDPDSPHNNSVNDIRICHNVITEIAKTLQPLPNEATFDYTGKNISIGWFDLLASFGDPGYEHKEDLTSGVNAA
ncbi:MAG: dihydroorotase, partial [Chitinophagales bacterium]